MTRMHWLNARRFTPDGGFRVTASDVAAIIGWHPARTAMDVYTSKVTASEIEDTVEMMMGRMFEEPIAQLYANLTGRVVVDPGPTTLFIHRDFLWLGATPDREIFRVGEEDSDGGALEIKHAGSYKMREWENGCPLWVQIQNQVQMACMDLSWGAYCGVVGGNAPKYGDLSFNADFLDSCIPDLEDFIRRCNENDPPPATKPRDLNAVKKLFPHDSGGTVYLNESHVELADEWEQSKIDRKTAEDKQKTLEAKIRVVIGEATFAELPDDTLLTLKTTVRKDGVRYRTLRRE